MTIFEKPEALNKSIGFYVRFETTNEPFYHVRTKVIGLSRYELVIRLPVSKSDNWVYGLEQIIDNVQDGSRWPLRLSWENTKQFFTLEQMAFLDSLLIDIPVYLYGVPNSHKEYLNALEKAKHAEYMRMKRSASGGSV